MIDNYLVPDTAQLPLAHYKLYANPARVLFVTDAEGKLEGFLTSEMFPPFSDTALELNVKEIMGCDVIAIPNGPTVYETGRNVMAEYPSINVLPIVDKVDRPIKIISRWQLFFKEEYFKAIRTLDAISMPYPQYAVAIWRAASVANAIGYKKFTVAEFGVAQGNGLAACELIANEIARIWHMDIDVLGFDGGQGLPAISDYRDCPQCWERGQFAMDLNALKKRLESARLITGNIADTWPEFIMNSDIPVGAMLVDVDYYSSTRPILAALATDKEKFLPIVNMYFDDIGGSLQFQGEALAIKEFNQKNDKIKISPEDESFGEFNFKARRYGFSKLKACMFFEHSLFTASGFKHKLLYDFWR